MYYIIGQQAFLIPLFPAYNLQCHLLQSALQRFRPIREMPNHINSRPSDCLFFHENTSITILSNPTVRIQKDPFDQKATLSYRLLRMASRKSLMTSSYSIKCELRSRIQHNIWRSKKREAFLHLLRRFALLHPYDQFAPLLRCARGFISLTISKEESPGNY